MHLLQIEHLDFEILWQYVNSAANALLFNFHNTIYSLIIDLFYKGQHCITITPQSALASIEIHYDA